MLRFYLGFTAKNIWRRKRRTILTAAAIAIGIMYFVMFDSLLAGADRDAQINTIDFETGHLWVGASQEGDATLARPTLEDTIPSGQAVAQAIAELPGVAGAAPRLVFPASLIAGLDELPVSAAGVDPEVDPQVFRISQFVSSGRWLERGEDGVVLGKRIADLLQLEPGDMVTVRTQTAQMAFQAVDLIVVGTVETPHPLVNQSQAFMPLDVAQAAVGAPGSATSIHVRAQSAAPSPSRRDLSGLTESISMLTAQDPGWRIHTWHDAASFLTIGSTKRVFAMILLGLVVIISVIGVVNSILLSTLERVREIGMLKAMGMDEGDITIVFMMEGGGLGLLGCAWGAVAAIAGNAYFVNVGLSLRAFLGDMDLDIGYPIVDRMYGVWNWTTMLWAIAVGLAVALAASYFPARRAARLDPVESLRRL
ncbi:MAG: ABC transporter permease [Bacillota bacterium]|jgi:putative ABC transport system permease protein